MARPKKQKDIEEAIKETKGAEAGPGHNGATELTDDEKRALFFQHKKTYQVALADKKTADAELKNVCKKAKAECGKDAVAGIKDAIEFEGEGGRAKFNAEIERKSRVARWLGLPVGVQAGFFDMNDRTPGVEIAEQEGFADGAAGERAAPSYDPAVPQHQAYMTGWHRGQETILAAMKKLEQPPVEGEVEHADTSDRPFDIGDGNERLQEMQREDAERVRGGADDDLDIPENLRRNTIPAAPAVPG